MTIIYALVSVGQNVLAEFSASTATGNFPTVTRVLLSKIPLQDGRMTHVYDNFQFHFIVESSICYLCMSDELHKHRIPYAFLTDVKDRFLTIYGREEPLLANAFSYNSEFSRVLEDRMNWFNSDQAERSIDSIGAVKNQLDDVKENMILNISQVLERGERLELLVEKSDNLNHQAFRFQASSRSLRQTLYWRRVRCYAGIAAAVVFLLVVAASTMCGGLDFRHCRKH